MSRLRNVKRHRRSLGEIRDIMNSMKSLAYMETRKLGSLADAQHVITGQIATAARDFLAFHPALLPQARGATRVLVVIGTERGFCGDFNQGLARHLLEGAGGLATADAILLIVGHKLQSALEHEQPRAARTVFIDGADVAEEAATVINRVVAELGALLQAHDPVDVTAVYRGDGGEVVHHELLPPRFETDSGGEPPCSHPPLLNLPADELLVELTDHYLFAILNEILYRSLLTENQHRVAHLTAAVKHLDEKTARLTHLANALHQEEIVEEIEVILLGEGGTREA